MLYLTTTDEFTFSNLVAKELNDNYGLNINSFNFGVNGFGISLELIKFIDLLKKIPVGERPKFVIFYDGYNDSVNSYVFGPEKLQEDINGKFRLLVNEPIELIPILSSVFFFKNTFPLNNLHNFFYNRYISKVSIYRKNFSISPQDSVNYYYENIKIIENDL